MAAPVRSTIRVEQAVGVTRDLYRTNPDIAAEYVADCRRAHALAAQRAEREVAIARYHHDMHVAAQAAYAVLKAGDIGGGT